MRKLSAFRLFIAKEKETLDAFDIYLLKTNKEKVGSRSPACLQCLLLYPGYVSELLVRLGVRIAEVKDGLLG